MPKLDKPRWELFAREYVNNGFNATKAAITAGYAESSAHVTGSRMLRNAKVWRGSTNYRAIGPKRPRSLAYRPQVCDGGKRVNFWELYRIVTFNR